MLLRVPSKNIREEYLKFEDLFSGTDTSFLRLLQTKWQSEQRLKKEEPKEKKSTKKVSPFDKDKGAGSKKKSPFDK